MNKAPDIFQKPYNSQEQEQIAQKLWNDSKFANPDECVAAGVTSPDAESFSIVLPPPNVTGVLHLGHAYEDALQDTVIRFKRMQGYQTLWIPGTDSAAIATQAKVENIVKKDEGKSRHDLGREELVRRVHEFAKGSENTIISQVRRLGASLDWSRYAYTLDDTRNRAVFTAFQNMYEAGLVYRGNRIVNWDPKGQTTVSDDEIVNEERTGKLYTFKYSHDFPIPIATTRPETKVGDVAVAVHPNDSRYAQYVGKEYDCVFCGSPIHIRVIADDVVEAEFGTGALGVTPAHSQIDWEMAQRHKLEVVPVINEYAKMIVGDERIIGKKTTDAREVIVEWLRDEGLMISEEDITQNLPTAERTGGVIEPLPKLQWFVAVDKPFVLPNSEVPGIASGSTVTLKQIMRIAVESEAVTMPQDNFRKSYFNWIENLHDWCISRQIWFGHRIPIWYRGEEISCGTLAPAGDGWEQDPDVLDTWFSSALWTFSTLGWPEKTTDFARFHPTAFMCPAYEILYLWISRMILMSVFHTGQVPFKLAMLHGIVRDSQGKKFSKSAGNGIDPLEIIEKQGADALRMGLLSGVAIGNDSRYDENKVRGFSKFSNKLWNISRYVLEQAPHHSLLPIDALTGSDVESWQELQSLIAEITPEMNDYKYYLVTEKLYHYIWHTFADVIIESTKPRIMDESEGAESSTSAQALLQHTLITCLKLLHPFMPHVSEAIWQQLPSVWKANDRELLMVCTWPSA